MSLPRGAEGRPAVRSLVHAAVFMKKRGMKLTLEVDYTPGGFQDVLAFAECRKFESDAESSFVETLKSGLQGLLALLVAAALLPLSLPIILSLFVLMILFKTWKAKTEDLKEGIISKLKIDHMEDGCCPVVINLLCCSCLVWLPLVIVTAAAASLAQVASNNAWLGAWFGVGGLLVLALCAAMSRDPSLRTNGQSALAQKLVARARAAAAERPKGPLEHASLSWEYSRGNFLAIFTLLLTPLQ